MDLIYNCAFATFIALAGDNSNDGLKGATLESSRKPQALATINGYDMAVMFPPLALEIQATTCTHTTRAWTLQEVLLSRRRILFCEDQVHFVCARLNCEETIDDGIDGVGIMERRLDNSPIVDFEHASLDTLSVSNKDLRMRATDEYYTFLVNVYAARSMTNDSDSLNACLGLLNFLHKTFVPNGFFWGLPLIDFPQSLRWYHARWTRPRRRHGFPSWSFVGWEGEADYTDSLLLNSGGSRGMRRYDVKVDMVTRLETIEDQIVTLRGHTLKMEIRNEPFNNAYLPDTDNMFGMLQEGTAMHKNTLPTGVFDFAVVERLKYRNSPESKMRHTLYLLMLGVTEHGIQTRIAMVRLYVDPEVVEPPYYAQGMQSLSDIKIA